MTLSAILRACALTAPLAFGLSLPAAASTLLPDFSAAVFLPGAAITNPYFPLGTGFTATIAARAEDESGVIEERSDHSYNGLGPSILGVATTTRLDRAFANGLLVEETFDYFAQDTLGNVWYLGEDVTNYRYDENGNLIGTDNASAWRAGVSGALPGWIMPANPVAGLSYFQEFAAADAALDEALIYATGQTVTVGGKPYTNVLVTFESTSLDPTARELKYYAPGIGLIRVEEGVDENFANPDLVFNRIDPAPVPLPAGLPLLIGALGGLAWLKRRVRPDRRLKAAAG
jgi:hypothetical protein